MSARTVLRCPVCGREYGTVKMCLDVELLCRSCGSRFSLTYNDRTYEYTSKPFVPRDVLKTV